ncbi:nickel-binding protein [Streptomyces sp. NPDC001292]|uniref:nickel-binding protein n=1 Tax=Streptomyces sp. NPDC001292 TaxID=3364558 RepID=UPI0036B8AFDC
MTDRGRRFFLVDRVLPTVGESDLQAAQRALDEAGRRLTADGEWVCCVHSTYVPSQRRWLCLFTASSAQVVRLAHEIAQIPVSRVDDAFELPVEHGQST